VSMGGSRTRRLEMKPNQNPPSGVAAQSGKRKGERRGEGEDGPLRSEPRGQKKHQKKQKKGGIRSTSPGPLKKVVNEKAESKRAGGCCRKREEHSCRESPLKGGKRKREAARDDHPGTMNWEKGGKAVSEAPTARGWVR